MLIIAAPHPTQPGAKLPDTPIRASSEFFLRQEHTSAIDGQRRPYELTPSFSGFNGHYLMTPIGTMTGSLAAPTLGWLSVTNRAVDKKGNAIGLVGLYIQTLVGPSSASAMAIRLSGDPSATSTP
jgi:hypothetical protein